MPPIVAPPSPAHVVTAAGGALAQGLAQAQTDAAALQALLTAWPADLSADLQPVVQIVERLVTYLGMVAQGVAAVAEHAGMTL